MLFTSPLVGYCDMNGVYALAYTEIVAVDSMYTVGRRRSTHIEIPTVQRGRGARVGLPLQLETSLETAAPV